MALCSSNKTPAQSAGQAAEPEMASRYAKLLAAAVQDLGLRHTLIMTPHAYPEVEIPYYVRQAGGAISLGKFICRAGRPHYYLVLFSTHHAAFTVHEFEEKQAAKQAYADAMDALLSTAPGLKPHGKTKVKYLRVWLGSFHAFMKNGPSPAVKAKAAGLRRAQVRMCNPL